MARYFGQVAFKATYCCVVVAVGRYTAALARRHKLCVVAMTLAWLTIHCVVIHVSIMEWHHMCLHELPLAEAGLLGA